MGLLFLLLLSAATAAALVLLTRRLAPGPPPLRVLLPLCLLPLPFTYAGFLPGTALAPTNLLTSVPPWLGPEIAVPVEAESGPANPLLMDPVSQMLPWRQAARERWLFNPYQGAGAALLANGQSAVLFPTEAAARWLPPLRAAAYGQAARLLVAVFGMFLLARFLALPEPAALLAAAVYAGAGFLHVWRLHPHSLVAAVAPFILWAALALVRCPGPLPALGLGVSGALGVFAGHPETLLKVVLLAAGVAVAGLVVQGRERLRGLLRAVLQLASLRQKRSVLEDPGGAPSPRPASMDERRSGASEDDPHLSERSEFAGRPQEAPDRLPRAIAWAIAGGLLALLLSAPLLLPFAENLVVSGEWQRRTGEVFNRFEVPWPEAMGRLAPAFVFHAYGDPLADPVRSLFAGPDNAAELGGGSLGMAALLLALLGVAWRPRQTWPWLLFGLLGLLLSAQTPGIGRFMRFVPFLGVSLLQRFSLWWTLAGSVLAGYGASALFRSSASTGAGRGAGASEDGSRLSERREFAGRPQEAPASHPRARTVVVALALLLALPIAVVAWRLPLSHRTTGAPLEAVVLLLTAAALVYLLQAPAGRRRWGALALLALLLVAPRVVHLGGWVPQVSPLSFYPETAAIRFVHQRGGPAGFRVAGLDKSFFPDVGSFYGLEDVRANDPMTLGDYERFSSLAGEVLPLGGLRLLDAESPILDFLGVAYLFDHPSMGRRPGVRPVYLGPDALVHENPRALPRLYLPREVVVAPLSDALSAVAAIDDFARYAVASTREPAGLPPPGVHPNGTARVARLDVRPGEIAATVEAETVTLVATSQPAIPGWRLWRDGVEHEPIRINGAFLGAAVEPGTSELLFAYRPRSWSWGWALCAMGLAGVLLLLIRARTAGTIPG